MRDNFPLWCTIVTPKESESEVMKKVATDDAVTRGSSLVKRIANFGVGRRGGGATVPPHAFVTSRFPGNLTATVIFAEAARV